MKDKTVLDIGCGTGYGCNILSEKAQEVYGIDHNADAIAYCRKNYHAPNVTYQQMNANNLNFDRRFEVIVSFQVIEHMKDLDGFVAQIQKVAEPESTILITTPNVRNPDQKEEKNPFHFNEMNYGLFIQLLNDKFTSAEVKGISYKSKNTLRSIVQKLPFYKWGRMLTRKSKIKKAASKALDLTGFQIIESNIGADAIDLLGICKV